MVMAPVDTPRSGLLESLSFFIQTFGCQMNDHDSVVLAQLLEEAGHREAPDPAAADVILVNTCAIREKAEEKVYSHLGRLRALKDSRPGVLLGVGGCMAQAEGRRVLRRAPYVDLVFGTKALTRVPGLLERARAGRRKLVAVDLEQEPEALEDLYAHSRGRGLKAFVTVMQGCDNFCAYCIVPHVRGREVSRPASDVVAEVQRLAADGVREVTLLGQNVNSYGAKGGDGTDFPTLLRRLETVEGIARLRFTTSHPKDLSPRLVELFAESGKLMPHLHLPVQSGSDRVLAAMNRRYTASDYLRLVDALRGARPGLAVTTDLIVGFPGETQEDFRATLDLMERVVFDNAFSFKFSPRRGTAAAELPDGLPDRVKEERLEVLQALQSRHTLRRGGELVGDARPVLVEGRSRAGRGQLTGRTPENKIVNFQGPQEWVGREVTVRIVRAGLNSLSGEPCEEVPCTCR